MAGKGRERERAYRLPRRGCAGRDRCVVFVCVLRDPLCIVELDSRKEWLGPRVSGEGEIEVVGDEQVRTRAQKVRDANARATNIVQRALPLATITLAPIAHATYCLYCRLARVTLMKYSRLPQVEELSAVIKLEPFASGIHGSPRLQCIDPRHSNRCPCLCKLLYAIRPCGELYHPHNHYAPKCTKGAQLKKFFSPT